MALGRIDITKRLLFRRDHRLHALLHFLRRDVFLMRSHPPEMPKRIFELARAVTVQLIHDGLTLRGAGGHSLLENGAVSSRNSIHTHGCLLFFRTASLSGSCYPPSPSRPLGSPTMSFHVPSG